VSMVKGMEVAGLTLPALSVAVADKGAPVAVPAQEYVPPTVAVVVQRIELSALRTVTVLPASAFPDTVTAPLVGLGLAVPVGAEGATLSKVNAIEPDELVLLAASVAVALSGPPFAVPAQENVPPTVAVVVQTTELSGLRTVTVEPVSALPVIVTGPLVGFGDAVPVGAFGATLSNVMVFDVAGLVPPALAAVIDSGPPLVVPAQENEPFAAAVVVHKTELSAFFTVTVEFPVTAPALPVTVSGPFVGSGEVLIKAATGAGGAIIVGPATLPQPAVGVFVPVQVVGSGAELPPLVSTETLFVTEVPAVPLAGWATIVIVDVPPDAAIEPV
jgi:hypothetical protein